MGSAPPENGGVIMQELNRTAEQFTDSVIRRMTRISLDCGAINLAQGFPDFDPPKALTDRLAEVSHIGPISDYDGRAEFPPCAVEKM